MGVALALHDDTPASKHHHQSDPQAVTSLRDIWLAAQRCAMSAMLRPGSVYQQLPAVGFISMMRRSQRILLGSMGVSHAP